MIARVNGTILDDLEVLEINALVRLGLKYIHQRDATIPALAAVEALRRAAKKIQGPHSHVRPTTSDIETHRDRVCPEH